MIRCASLVLASGCAYMTDRLNDFADIFTVEAGVGLGLHADVKATDYAHVGARYADLRKAGFRGREFEFTRDREVGLPPIVVLWWPAVHDGHVDRAAHWHGNTTQLRAYQDQLVRKGDTPLIHYRA